MTNFENALNSRSFFMRHFRHHMFLLLLTSLIFSASALFILTRRTTSETEQKLSLMSNHLSVQTEVMISRYGYNKTSAIMMQSDDYKVSNLIYELSAKHLAEDLSSKIIFFDKNGDIFLYYDPFHPYDKRETINIDYEFSHQVLEFTSLDNFFDEPHYSYTTEILDNFGDIVAYVVVAMPSDEYTRSTNFVITWFSFAIIIIVFISFIALYFATSKTTFQLNSIKNISTKYARGDLSSRLEKEKWYCNEIEDLALNMNKMAEFLSTTEEKRDVFISNISHEIKTPLTTIAGFTDGIIDGTIQKEDEEKCLKIISGEVKRLSRLTARMLHTAKLTSENFKIFKEPFDFTELLLQVMFSFETQIENKNIEMDVFIDENIMVMSDRDNMHQVLFNLIENATKYVNENGSISISLKKVKDKTRFAVTNTGETIPKEKISQICDRFVKVDDSRSADTKSVGLGLYIVKKILNMHDTDIELASKNGLTTFTFII